jgi:hypothetical protein
VIETLPAYCWRLVDRNGNDRRDDAATPHYDTADDALAERDDMERPDFQPARFDRPCVIVRCNGCGAVVDCDEFTAVHYPDPATARRLAPVFVYGPGELDAWCEDCVRQTSADLERLASTLGLATNDELAAMVGEGENR